MTGWIDRLAIAWRDAGTSPWRLSHVGAAQRAPGLAGPHEQAAHAAVQQWLERCEPGSTVVDWRTLQAGEAGHAVVEFTVVPVRDGGDVKAPARHVIAKCLAGQQVEAVGRITAAVQSAACEQAILLRVPPLLQVDTGHRVLVQEHAGGRMLAGYREDEVPALKWAIQACGVALVELHHLEIGPHTGLQGDPGPAKEPGLALAPRAASMSDKHVDDVIDSKAPSETGIDAQIEALMHPHPLELASLCPALADAVLAVHERLRQGAARFTPVRQVLIHRDVHPRQIFIGPGQVELIDWDLCSRGDPALDLANLRMHIELRWPDRADALHCALRQGYGIAYDELEPRLPLYHAFHQLRRACKAWRQAGAYGWTGSPGRSERPIDAATCARIDQHLARAQAHLDELDLSSAVVSHAGASPASAGLTRGFHIHSKAAP